MISYYMYIKTKKLRYCNLALWRIWILVAKEYKL